MENPSAAESQPVHCYTGQQDEILRLCRRLFIMSPCIPVWVPEQIRVDEWEHPIFLFNKNHPKTVPWDKFLPYLTDHQATIVEIEFGGGFNG